MKSPRVGAKSVKNTRGSKKDTKTIPVVKHVMWGHAEINVFNDEDSATPDIPVDFKKNTATLVSLLRKPRPPNEKKISTSRAVRPRPLKNTKRH